MGHFSDYTYLQRGINSVFLFFYFVWSLWRADGFRTLSFERIRRFELKSIVCLLLVIGFPLEFFYDFSSVRITYAEGYIINPADGQTYIKPQDMWTPEDQATVVYMDYIFDVSLSLEASILFLLQCFWNYLASSITKKSFMSSVEWKIYLVWAVITLALTPVLQYAFSYDKLSAEVYPQMAFGIETLVVSCLGVLSHIRFNRLVASYEVSKRQVKNDVVVSKLNYFREMNGALTICLFFVSAMVLTLCADALTPAKVLNRSKEITDVCICIANTSSFLVWVLLVSIFFPSRTFATNTSNHAATTQDDTTAIQMTAVKTGVYTYQGPQSQHLSPSAVARPPSAASNAPVKGGIVKSVTVDVDEASTEDSAPLRPTDYYYPAQ